MEVGIGRRSDQFNLRLPDGLRDRLKEMADQNRRSMNGQAVVILENALKATETKKADVPA